MTSKNNRRIHLELNFRKWWFLPFLVVIFGLLLRPMQVAWLKNLAIMKLAPAWSVQTRIVLDPPCVASWKFPVEKKYLEASINLAPPNPGALTLLGRALWLEGNCNEAISKWNQADIYHYQPAEYELLRVGEYTTFSANTRLQLADYAFRQGVELRPDLKNEAAVQWLYRAFELVPQRRIVTALVLLHQKKGDAFDASGLWQKIINVDPVTNADHWYAVGALDDLNSDWESAAGAFTEGANLSSDSYEFWLAAGNAWERANNLEKALECFENANRTGPKYITAYLSIGTVYLIQQKYQTALDWYSKARELFPQASDPYYNLGESYFLMGDYVQARYNLEAALKIEPTSQGSMYYLAQISYHEGEHASAESWLVKAINQEPNPQSSNLGPWWLQLGDWRLEWHNCPGAREAYTDAAQTGESEETVKQKMKILVGVCGI